MNYTYLISRVWDKHRFLDVLGFYFTLDTLSSIFRGNLNAASVARTQKGPTKMGYRCVNFRRAAHANGIAKVQRGTL